MQNDKQLDNKVVRNADYEVFLTNGARGHLEYAGEPFGGISGRGFTTEACRRREVWEKLAGFEIQEVLFRRELNSPEWHEIDRQAWETHQSRADAVEAVKIHQDSYRQAVAEDLEDQRDRARVEARYEFELEPHRAQPTRALAAEFRAAIDARQREEIEMECSDDGETQMNDGLLRGSYEAQQLRIERLEAWIEQVVARPSMSRELRLEGLELIEARSPDIRLAVERICPSRSQDLGHSLELER